jgi:thiol-disulfide isomerase/thioredoxin
MIDPTTMKQPGRRAVLAGGAAAILAASMVRPRAALAQGEFRMWDFTLIDADHQLVSTADWRGQALFVHFFGSWCPPCRREIPALAKAVQSMAGRDDVRFVFLNALESTAKTQKFLDEVGAQVPLYDSLNRSREEQRMLRLDGTRVHNFRDLHVATYPTTWIVDRGGMVRRVVATAQSAWESWAPTLIDEALKAPYTPPAMPKPDELEWLYGTWRGMLDDIPQEVRILRGTDGVPQWGMGRPGEIRGMRAVKSATKDEVLLAASFNSGNSTRLLARPGQPITGAYLFDRKRGLVTPSFERVNGA